MPFYWCKRHIFHLRPRQRLARRFWVFTTDFVWRRLGDFLFKKCLEDCIDYRVSDCTYLLTSFYHFTLGAQHILDEGFNSANSHKSGEFSPISVVFTETHWAVRPPDLMGALLSSTIEGLSVWSPAQSGGYWTSWWRHRGETFLHSEQFFDFFSSTRWRLRLLVLSFCWMMKSESSVIVVLVVEVMNSCLLEECFSSWLKLTSKI